MANQPPDETLDARLNLMYQRAISANPSSGDQDELAEVEPGLAEILGQGEQHFPRDAEVAYKRRKRLERRWRKPGRRPEKVPRDKQLRVYQRANKKKQGDKWLQLVRLYDHVREYEQDYELLLWETYQKAQDEFFQFVVDNHRHIVPRLVEERPDIFSYLVTSQNTRLKELLTRKYRQDYYLHLVYNYYDEITRLVGSMSMSEVFLPTRPEGEVVLRLEERIADAISRCPSILKTIDEYRPEIISYLMLRFDMDNSLHPELQDIMEVARVYYPIAGRTN